MRVVSARNIGWKTRATVLKPILHAVFSLPSLIWIPGFLWGAASGKPLEPEQIPQAKTIVEHERGPGLWANWKTRWVLGTGYYKASEKEAPFFERLGEDERITGDFFHDYSITGKVGHFVGWFGIVRRIEESKEKDTTELLVEMKYFDGLTDLHILTVSFNGGGDFKATLAGTDHKIKPLSLVKVYGEVKKEPDSVPRVSARYVREWDWGAFAFMMAYGKQKGNTKWRKLNQVPLADIYDPRPNRAYYEKRLGKRPDMAPPSE